MFRERKKRRCCDVSVFLIKCDCKRWVILMSDDRNLKSSKFAPSFLWSFVRSFFEASLEKLRSLLRKSSFLKKKIENFIQIIGKICYFFQRCEISRILYRHDSKCIGCSVTYQQEMVATTSRRQSYFTRLGDLPDCESANEVENCSNDGKRCLPIRW
jgi:hypothetical protein